MRSLTERAWRFLVWVVPIAAVICLLCWCYVAVRPTFAWDDAEPEILNQAWRLSRGEEIYRSIDLPPYLHTAYPPVYFAVVAMLLKVTGLSYIPAKLVSILSTLAIGGVMMTLAAIWKRDQKWGLWSLCLLLLVPAFLYNSTRSHVQMLAVALSLISFLLFLGKGRFSLVFSALIAVLAVYTKQTQIALPLAMVAYLALRDLRRLLIYLITLLLAGVPPLLWLQPKTDGYFLEHLITLNRLSYSFADIGLVILHWAGPLALLIGLASYDVWARVGARRKEEMEALDYYFIAVVITTVVACGRLGAHSQYVVELCVLTMLLVLRRWEPTGTLQKLLVVQSAVLLIYAPLFIFVEEGRFGMASNRAAPRVRQLLNTVPGPVLAQQSSFSLFSRGEIPIQLFHFTALARAGRWDMRKLQREVERGSFVWVVTEFPLEAQSMSADDLERFTPEVVQSMQANYVRVDEIPPYFIYRPLPR